MIMRFDGSSWLKCSYTMLNYTIKGWGGRKFSEKNVKKNQHALKTFFLYCQLSPLSDYRL